MKKHSHSSYEEIEDVVREARAQRSAYLGRAIAAVASATVRGLALGLSRLPGIPPRARPQPT